MARYYEGVNGSMQGTAGGVNVYNWRGVWLQRSRRKEVLNFRPTASQQVVIQNFAELSKVLKPFRLAFKAAIKTPPAGQTAYSAAAKLNYARQKTLHYDSSTHLINFSSADVVLGQSNLGGYFFSLTEGRDEQLSVSWETPTIESPLYGGNVLICIQGSTGGVVTYTIPLDAGTATVSYLSVQLDAGDEAHAFVCAYTADGSSNTTHMQLN